MTTPAERLHSMYRFMSSCGTGVDEQVHEFLPGLTDETVVELYEINLEVFSYAMPYGPLKEELEKRKLEIPKYIETCIQCGLKEDCTCETNKQSR